MNSPLKPSTGIRGNSQIILIVVIASAGVVALLLGNTVGIGDYKNAYLIVLFMLGLFFLFKLQASFWTFIPFAMVSDLPTIPLGGASLDLGQLWILGSILCVLIYWPMEGKTLKLHVKRLWPVYIYVLIAFITYLRNPVGLGSLGASAGGMSYYVIIGLGFIGMLILSNYSVDNKIARKIVIFLILGVCVEFAWKMGQHYLPALSSFTGRSAGSDQGGAYGSSQTLAIVPVIVLPIIFGRFRLSQILTPQRMWLLVIILACYVALLLSGKRSLCIIALTFPAMAEFFRGKWGTAVVTGALGAMALAGVVFLHVAGVELPLTAQRVLTVLPGDWDADMEQSADNSFRDTLNRIALERIRSSPIEGRGFKVDFEMAYLLNMDPGQVLLPGEHVGGAVHSTTSNWHNTWLGITADFGLFATAAWACVWLMFCVRAWRLRKAIFRMPGETEWMGALILAMMMWTGMDIVRSWQFGHSALNLWTISWRFGLLLALENYVRKPQEEPATASDQVGGRSRAGFEPAMSQRTL